MHTIVLLIGAVAGYAATKVMEWTSVYMYRHQNEAARRKEESLRTDDPTTVLMRKIDRALNLHMPERHIVRWAIFIHYLTGIGGGVLAGLLVTFTDMPPMLAGLAVGFATSLFLDEGINYVLKLTAPFGAWPTEAHIRGFVVHIVYGIVIGLLLLTWQSLNLL